jgi:hypothetical protein
MSGNAASSDEKRQFFQSSHKIVEVQRRYCRSQELTLDIDMIRWRFNYKLNVDYRFIAEN